MEERGILGYVPNTVPTYSVCTCRIFIPLLSLESHLGICTPYNKVFAADRPPLHVPMCDVAHVAYSRGCLLFPGRAIGTQIHNAIGIA